MCFSAAPQARKGLVVLCSVADVVSRDRVAYRTAAILLLTGFKGRSYWLVRLSEILNQREGHVKASSLLKMSGPVDFGQRNSCEG